jgi:hypothetical protein
MAPWMFDIKFPCDTQLTFGSLIFAVDSRAPGSGFIIGIRRILLRIGSLCRELHPHSQDRLGYPDRDIHPPALG